MLFSRKLILFLGALFSFALALANEDPLPSWRRGSAKEAILKFVESTTDPTSAKFVPIEERIVTFDQDGTLWVEQPIYPQMVYCLDRLRDLSNQNPSLKEEEPYKTALSENFEDVGRLSTADLEQVIEFVLTGMTVEEFQSQVSAWIETAKHPRWKRLYTELAYLPMQELILYFQKNGFKTYIVTGGGQDFVRTYAEKIYQIPKEQVVGTASGTRYEYDKRGRPVLFKEPRLLLNDNNAGKPEGIHLMIGRVPRAAFGNSVGDRQMLEYTKGGEGARMAFLVLHDDPDREYAYGPALGLPNSKVGTFTQSLFDEAVKNGWVIISMKNDWKSIFSFEQVK
jgi:hypothetical protein